MSEEGLGKGKGKSMCMWRFDMQRVKRTEDERNELQGWGWKKEKGRKIKGVTVKQQARGWRSARRKDSSCACLHKMRADFTYEIDQKYQRTCWGCGVRKERLRLRLCNPSKTLTESIGHFSSKSSLTQRVKTKIKVRRNTLVRNRHRDTSEQPAGKTRQPI
jgi:hypothetical protein